MNERQMIVVVNNKLNIQRDAKHVSFKCNKGMDPKASLSSKKEVIDCKVLGHEICNHHFAAKHDR